MIALTALATATMACASDSPPEAGKASAIQSLTLIDAFVKHPSHCQKLLESKGTFPDDREAKAALQLIWDANTAAHEKQAAMTNFRLRCHDR